MTMTSTLPPMVAAAALAGLVAVLRLDRYGREPLLPVASLATLGAGTVLLLRALAARATEGTLGASLLVPAFGRSVLSLEGVVIAAAVPMLLGLAGGVFAASPTRFPGLSEPLLMGAAPALAAGAVEAVVLERPWAVLLPLPLWWGAAGALAGLGMGVARRSPHPAQRVVAAAVAPAGSVAVTTLGGGISAELARSAAGDRAWLVAGSTLLPGVLLCLAVVAAVVAEGRVIRDALEHEVSLGVLPSWVVPAVAAFRARAFGRWWEPREERRAVVQALVKLAFRSWAWRSTAARRGQLAGLEVGRLRQRCRELLELRQEPAHTVLEDG